jgi:hypothetical protein
VRLVTQAGIVRLKLSVAVQACCQTSNTQLK